MLSARKTALYAALLGLAFIADDASAACSPAILRSGVLICMNGGTGSFICDVTAQVVDGSEGFSNFSPTNQPSSACSYRGGTFDPEFETLLRPLFTPSYAFNGPTKAMGFTFAQARNGPKKFKCVNGFLIGTGRRTPCTEVPNSDGKDLFNGPNEVNTLPPGTPPTVTMSCSTQGVCTSTQEILPTGLTCFSPTGPAAIDYTPDGSDPFIVKVEVCEAGGGDCVDAFFGCNGLQGGNYQCEGISGLDGLEGGDCGTGETSGGEWCVGFKLPNGDLICEGGSTL